MRRTLAERKAYAEQFPWVRKLKERTPCDGIKWGQVALRDLYEMHGKEPRGIQDRARCKRLAHWRYTKARSDPWTTSGNYCWTHLVSQLRREGSRQERWLKAYGGER